jgi:hypothetical protein
VQPARKRWPISAKVDTRPSEYQGMKTTSNSTVWNAAETVRGLTDSDRKSDHNLSAAPSKHFAKPLPKGGPEEDADEVRPSLWHRLYYALGPIAGCLVLDLVDFVTLGPIGLVIGIPVGAAVGWWLGSLYGLERTGRITVAVMSAVYCTIPFTEILPLATLSGAIGVRQQRVARLVLRPQSLRRTRRTASPAAKEAFDDGPIVGRELGGCCSGERRQAIGFRQIAGQCMCLRRTAQSRRPIERRFCLCVFETQRQAAFGMPHGGRRLARGAINRGEQILGPQAIERVAHCVPVQRRSMGRRDHPLRLWRRSVCLLDQIPRLVVALDRKPAMGLSEIKGRSRHEE